MTDEEMADLEVRFGQAEVLEFASLADEIVAASERGPDPAFADVDDDELVERFLVEGSEVTAAMCRWLTVLGEIVRRRIWVAHGARTPTEWLSYYVSMAPSTAREHVRVALRLPHFPSTTERFAAGRLSYSKVRAITRTGRPDLEQLLLRYAEVATGAQLERVLRGFQRARRDQRARTVDVHDLRDVELLEGDDGTCELRIRLPQLEAMTAMAQLRHRASKLRDDALTGRDPADPETRLPSERQLLADAFLQATDGLSHDRPDTSGADRHTLVIHTDATLLGDPDHPSLDADDADEPSLDAEVEPTAPVRASAEARLRPMSVRTLRRLACDARLAVVAHDQDGNVVSASGTTHKVPARLRRLLYARDRHCRFPSCHATRGLEAHHIVFWSDDGPTILSNLVLLCRYHHTFVHERRWKIHHDGQGHFRFQPPQGEVMPTVHRPPVVDPLRRFSAHGWEELDFDPDGLLAGWDGQPSRPDDAITAIFDELDRLAAPAHLVDAAVAA